MNMRLTILVTFALVSNVLVRKRFKVNSILGLLTFLASLKTVESSAGAWEQIPRSLQDRISYGIYSRNSSTDHDFVSFLKKLVQRNHYEVEILYDSEHKEAVIGATEEFANENILLMMHQYDGHSRTLRLLLESASSRAETFLVTFCSFLNVLDIFQKVKKERLKSHFVEWILIVNLKEFVEESVVALEDLVFEGTQVTLVTSERNQIHHVLEASANDDGHIQFYIRGLWDTLSKTEKLQMVRLREMRRYWNMNGRKLKLAANSALPYFELGEQKPDGTYEATSGMELAVLQTLSQFMNFTYFIIRPPDGGWGYPQPDGTITGMIGMVARREVHLALCGIEVNAKRKTVVDYATPYLYDYLGIFSRAPKERNRALAVLSPFTQLVWLCLLISALLIGPIMMIHAKASQIIGTDLSNLDLQEYSFYMFRTLVMQGNPLDPSHWSQRIMLFAWYLFCFIMYAVYAGLLTAVLAVPAFEKPIETLHDIPRAVADGFTISVVGQTTNEYYFRDATEGIMKEIWSLFNHNDRSKSFLPKSIIGLELVLEKKHVHMGPVLVAELLAGKLGRNKFHFGRGVFSAAYDAFTMPPGAPYGPPMNLLITKMREAGLIHKWLNEELRKHAQRISDESTDTRMVITLVHLQAAFFILILGYLISTLVLVIEKIRIAIANEKHMQNK